MDIPIHDALLATRPRVHRKLRLAGEFVDHLLTREDASDPTEISAQALRRRDGRFEFPRTGGRTMGRRRRSDVTRRRSADQPSSKNLSNAKGPGSFIARLSSTRRSTSAVLLGATVLLVSLIVAVTTTFGGSPPVGPKAVQHGGTVGNAQLVGNEAPEALTADRATTTTVNLPSATVPPAPAPPSLAAAPPLRPHEDLWIRPLLDSLAELRIRPEPDLHDRLLQCWRQC